MKISKKKVISDSIFLSLGDTVLKLKGIIFIPIIISSVGIANYGAFIQILINVSMIIPFCTLELGMGFYRYSSKYEETETDKLSRDYWTVFAAVFILSLLGGFFIYLLSPIISKNILAGTSLNSLRLSSLFVVNAGLYYVDSKYIQSRKKFKLYSIYNLLYELMPYLGFLVGILMRSEVFFGLLLYLIIQSALMLSLKIYIIRVINFSIPSILILKKFSKYSWPLLFSVLSGGILSKLDRYFIGYFVGPTAIGIYNIIYSICGFLYIFAMPFNKYFVIYLPKVWDKGEQNRVREQLKEGLLYYLIISVGGLAGITLLLKPAMMLILNKDFSTIVNFDWIVLFIGLGIIGFGTSKFFYQLIKYREQTYLQFVFQVISVLLNIGLNYFLVKEYGIIGAAIATFVSYIAVVIMCNYYLDMDLDLNFLTKLLRIGIASLSIILWLYFHSSNSYLNIGLNILIGSVFYIFFIFLLRVVRFRDIRMRFT